MTAHHHPQDSGPPKSRVQGKFKPGQSGNPKGRPKKTQAAPKLTRLEEGFLQLFDKESERQITVTEAGKQRTMTALEAVLRATFNSAIKGSAQAQRTVLQLGIESERRKQQVRAEILAAALSLQQALEEHLDGWVAAGRDPRDIPEHPEDVEIDFATGEVRTWLPLTDAVRKARAEGTKVRDKLIKWIARAEATLAEEGDDELVHAGLALAREWLPRFNEALPPRLRRERLCELPLSAGERGPADVLLLPRAGDRVDRYKAAPEKLDALFDTRQVRANLPEESGARSGSGPVTNATAPATANGQGAPSEHNGCLS